MRLHLVAAFMLSPLSSAAGPVEDGAALVKRNCSGCHAVTQYDASPNPRAIPFRFIGRLYPINHLEEALAEGILVGHEMPEFVLNLNQVTAVIRYLESIQVR
ncbi:c-type cytochrome [Pseudotabrizicola sp. L79]|uniref:c-type cytochrome n=1 Tax=Pseudotabrizicola sp. L79 TaxID=3118402 RepID=UPI002F937438